MINLMMISYHQHGFNKQLNKMINTFLFIKSRKSKGEDLGFKPKFKQLDESESTVYQENLYLNTRLKIYSFCLSKSLITF